MDQNSAVSLAKYLNHYIDPNETCDRTLQKTIAWLKANEFDVDSELVWLENQGIMCDCDIVINIYMQDHPI